MTPSEQARADAMADAETLRRNVRVTDRKRIKALGDIDRLSGSLRTFMGRNEDADYKEAQGAARAAFRAVPGLRDGTK
jgi:hypothetical protein